MLGFRNPWTFAFMGVFLCFTIMITLVSGASGDLDSSSPPSYTAVTGGLLNLILILVPLMALLLGSFSITSDKEEGMAALLFTYPLRNWQYMLGKFLGLLVVHAVTFAITYGSSAIVAGFVGTFSGALQSLGIFMGFSLLLAMLYLAIALSLGSLVNTRWQALTGSVGIWFFTIMSWTTLAVASLQFVPYLWIKPIVTVMTIVNPAELVRVFIVAQLGGGSIFGPEYVEWVEWLNDTTSGMLSFVAFIVAELAFYLIIATSFWKRGVMQGGR